MSRSSKDKSGRARAGGALTPRAVDVLALVASGDPTQLTSVYRTTGSRNRVQAARHYLAHYGDPAVRQ